MEIDKESVKQSFSQSAASYDHFADLHEQIIAKLFSQLSKDYKRILDIGSGTGTLVAMLAQKYPRAKIAGVDLAEGMVEFSASKVAEKNVNFLVGDGEKLPFSDTEFDLVVSSSSLQWMDSKKVFAEVARVLKPGGDFCFSTFGPATLGELKGVGLAVNEFPAKEELERILADYFEGFKISTEVIAKRYNNVYELFSYLRAIGAQNPQVKAGRGLLTKNKLESLFLGHEGIDGTFEVYLTRAVKI